MVISKTSACIVFASFLHLGIALSSSVVDIQKQAEVLDFVTRSVDFIICHSDHELELMNIVF